MKAKKTLALAMTASLLVTAAVSLTACDNGNTIYVDTNAYFAPFEYYGGTSGKEIVGVDIDIMNLVGEKLGKKVKFENTDFDVIIDNVSKGKKYDCGAAGITVTEARKEKVDFSTPYFTSVQYVIAPTGTFSSHQTDGDTSYVYWDDLAGKKIGVQRDTTGDIYAGDEIAENGVLYGAGASLTQYDSAQLAADAVKSNHIDVVIVDKLPAEYIVTKNTGFESFALYYKGQDGEADSATEEQYAICVTKGNEELLNAINEVLKELGESGVNNLVSKHLGIEN